MAVEIPVVIDIEAAFEDAANRVASAMRPLKRTIETEAKDLTFNISGDVNFPDIQSLDKILKTVKDDASGINYAFDHLVIALEEAKKRLNVLETTRIKTGKLSDFQEIRADKLREAIVLLESEIDLRTRAGNVTSEAARKQIAVNHALADGNAWIGREAKTMQELSDKISALRGKLDNLNLEDDPDEWEETAREIKDATEELSKYQQKYNEIVKGGPAPKVFEPGSLNQLRDEMNRLQDQWNAMGRDKKFDADGKLTAEAQKLVDDYKKAAEESEKYGKTLSEAAGRAEKSIKKTTTALNTQNSVLNNLASTAMRYFSIYSVLRFAKQVRDVTGELEFQRVALGRLIQDEEYGAQLFEKIKEQAIKSPFRITQLVTYTKQLAAYRIEQEKLFDTTQMLADISAGLGVEMNRLILAYGQVRSAAVLRGQELRQFTEAGIPLVQLLADKFSDLNGKAVKTADVFELISKRAVPFSMISEIFEDMTEKGGMFYQMQEKQADTLKGKWEKLKDAFDIGLQTIGDTKTFERYNKIILDSLTLLAKNLYLVPKLIEAVSAAWLIYYVATMKARRATRLAAMEEVREAAATEAQAALKGKSIRVVNAYTYALVRQKVATNALSKSFWKLWAAIVANPWGALLAVVGAVATAFLTFNKRTDEIENSFEKLDDVIEKTSKGLSNTDKIDKLIDRYETLAKKTDRTVRESNRLYQTISRLQEEFPEMAIGIEEETSSLDEQISKMKELNSAMKQDSHGSEVKGAERVDTKKFDKLIEKYEALAIKTDRTAKENERLFDIMSQLKEQFPDVAIGVEQETMSLDEQIAKLRDLNTEKERELRNTGEAAYRANEIKLEEAEAERNKLYKERLRLQKALARVDTGRIDEVQKGSYAEKEWSKQLNDVNEKLAEQDDIIGKLQKRLERLNAILHPESAESPFNAWQQQIKKMGDISVGGVTMQIFSDEDIEKWETLDQALDAIAQKKQKAIDRENKLTEAIKSQKGEIREQVQAELDWATAERRRLEAMESFYSFPTLFAKNINKNFGDALLQTYDKGNIEAWAKAAIGYLTMQTNIDFKKQAMLMSRPIIDAAELAKKGWEDAGEGIATVFSSVYDFEDDKGNKHNIMVTPILPDGSVLSPDELEKYVDEVIKGGEDKWNIVIGFDVTPDAGERLHEMQERLVELREMNENLPAEFLISGEDLAGLKQASDVIELVDSKIKKLEDEIKIANSVNLEGISEEEAEKTQKYIKNLERVYEILKKIRETYKVDSYSYLAKEIIDNFKDALGAGFEEIHGEGVTVPVEFLISDNELKDIKNTTDLFDLLDNKIADIRKELETASQQNLDGIISDEAREQAEMYRLSLQGSLDILLRMRGQYQNVFSGLAKEIQGHFPRLMESFYAGKDSDSFTTTGLFSEDDLKRLKTYVDLQSLVTSKYSAVTAALDRYNGQLSETVDLEVRRKLLDQIEQLEGDKKALEDLAKTYAIVLEKLNSGPSTEDPWIIIYKNRLKFVQDFSNGVQNLNKVMAKNNAIAKEREIMEGRGLNLGFNGKNGELDVMQMTGSREEVLKWYDDTIKKIQKKIQKLGAKSGFAGLGVQAILAKDTKNRTIKAWQELLADVFNQKTDFQLSQTQKDIENAISRMKDNIKRSETVRNFYNDILSATGDEDLATQLSVSVYGGIGKDFSDRIQDQLNEAFESFDASDYDLWDKMRISVENQDFGFIMENIEKFPDELQPIIREMAGQNEKYYADLAKNIIKAYEKEKDYDERRTDVHRREVQARLDIDKLYQKELASIDEQERSGKITKEEAETKRVKAKKTRDTNTAASKRKEKKDQAAIDVEQLKNTYEWTKAFDDLNKVGNETLANLAQKIQEIINKEAHLLTPEQLKAMTEALNKVQTEQGQRNPLQAITGGIEAAQMAKMAMAAKSTGMASVINVAKAAMDEFNKSGKSATKLDFDHLEDSLKAANEEIMTGIQGVADYMSAWKGVVDTVTDAFDLDEVPVLGEALEGVSKALGFVASILPVIIALNTVLNEVVKANPFIAIAAAAVALIGLIAGLIKGLINNKVKKLNEQIEAQGQLIKNLEKSYDRLNKAIEDAFGSEYIALYNQQLTNLKAQADAYREQARLEREKGKKADESKAQEYEEAARDIEDKIADARTQLSEFFAGTDVASAAADFAKSWIEAYKTFSSTTNAMKEKFNEMIENMVVNSLAAKLVQNVLQPIFDEIDRASKDGSLTAQEMGTIANMVPGAINTINSGMNTLMSQLTSAGINLRQQATSMTGISRDIAGASEESINGLAAGVNTQNFYLQHIDQNLSMIVLALTGGTASTQTATAGEFVDTYKDTMLQYAQYMPDINQTLIDILGALNSVITMNGTKRAIQVKV